MSSPNSRCFLLSFPHQQPPPLTMTGSCSRSLEPWHPLYRSISLCNLPISIEGSLSASWTKILWSARISIPGFLSDGSSSSSSSICRSNSDNACNSLSWRRLAVPAAPAAPPRKSGAWVVPLSSLCHCQPPSVRSHPKEKQERKKKKKKKKRKKKKKEERKKKKEENKEKHKINNKKQKGIKKKKKTREIPQTWRS